ncbi:hypothetical protein niasHS_010467 [Heterodera schachtii]|uniref:RidA family protein n=1 Tax=Heterodera schachtii TaxID=97005 RepID=A0ABD2IZC2_HETSC
MAAPSIRIIATSKAPAATGYRWSKQWMTIEKAQLYLLFFSQAVLVNNQTLYVSGQTGMMPGKTDVVSGGARAEAKQAMTNIGELLTYAGSSFKHGVYQLQHHGGQHERLPGRQRNVQELFTADTYPARSFFQVVKLPKNALVMIDAVAVVSGQ